MAKQFNLISFREGPYITSWLSNCTSSYLRANEHNINTIVDDYEKTVPLNAQFAWTSAERYKYVKEYLLFKLHNNPSYKRLLKQTGLTDFKLGKMMGYVTRSSWQSSLKRVNFINTLMTVQDLSVNNPAFNTPKRLTI